MAKATFLFREGRLHKQHIASQYFPVQASFLLKYQVKSVCGQPWGTVCQTRFVVLRVVTIGVAIGDNDAELTVWCVAAPAHIG
jgi:hypothetical protein